MEEKGSIINGYSICFNKASLDKNIKNELGLLNIISSLSAKTGYCFASNEFLANLFDLPKETISRKLKILSDNGYITIEYDKKGYEVTDRKIRLTNLLTGDYQNCYSTINKNVKYNNIKIKNINNKRDIYIGEIQNFKPVLNAMDFEMINQIIDKYSLEELKRAIKVCKDNNAYSIKYLLQVLVNKPKVNQHEWLDKDIKTETIPEEDVKELLGGWEF